MKDEEVSADCLEKEIQTNVNGRMDSLYFADQVNIADFEDLSDGARQIVKSNWRFDTLSEETRPDLLDLGNKFQSEPGKYYLARSVTFYRNGSMSDLGSTEDGSELRARSLCQNEIPLVPKAEFCDANMKKSEAKGELFERHWRQKENGSREMVKKNTGRAKNMTHSVQADGDASDHLGGRDMGKLESHSKFNSFSFSAQQSEEICARERPMYWREKENGSKDRTETMGSIVFQQRSKPEHEIPCLQNQSGHKKLCNDSKHKDMPKKSMWFSNPKDEQRFQTFINEKHGPLLKVGEPSSSKENFQFLDGIKRQDVIKNKEKLDTDKKVRGMKDRENKGVPKSKCKIMIKQKYKTMKPEDEMNPKSKKIQHSLSCLNVSNVAENGSYLGVCSKYRLGDGFKYKFEVQNIESITFNGQRNTKVTLPFPSKVVATKDKTFQQQSNKTSTTKLLTYFPEQKMRKFIVLDPNETESRFEQYLKIIVERATYTLGLHKSKINENSKRVMKLKKFKSEKKNRREIKLENREGGKKSLREFENTESEIKATKDKCNELELQMKEFCSYIQCVYGKLEEIKNSVKFETKMNEIRIAFGIECRRLSEALPIYARRSDILSTVMNSQVSVILGETGSGKSTQIGQYLYQAGLAEHGLIACTQPRKIAAVTLATHVASEMASSVGQIVGYHVGMKVKRTKITKILYMTDHILLNECLKDNELKNFACIIIDEAHERSIFTDLLLGMIKSALKKRLDLKVIITSATINPDVFVSYFGGPEKCPVVCVSGRAYPVELVWLNPVDDLNPFDDYVTKAVNTAVNLHRQNPPADGDILVFLTTPLETEKCCEEFVQKCPTDDSFQCLPLHGKLQPEAQQKVFQPNTPNKRKVVFATNSAETSITIPGVKFVVDTGLAKEMRFDPKRNISSLCVYPISQSSAEQRKGRAGRTSPGKCYRLYNKKTYETMEKSTKPEILRIHLGQALLKLLELGVDPLSFDFVESPSREALENAIQSLRDIGAVEDNKISRLGRWISKLPIEPRQGLLLKKGILAGIPMEALVVASFSGGVGTFYRSGTEEEKKKADIKKIEFCHKGGDTLTLLNLYRRWDKVAEKQKGAWCFQNCINAKSLRGVRETMNELRTILKRDLREDILFEFRSVEEADPILKKVLIETLKQNVCCFLGHEKAGYFNLVNHQHVQVHPSSVLKPLDLQPELIVYEQFLQTSADFVTNITPVNEEEMILLPSEVLDIYKSTKDKIRVSLKQTYWAGKKVLKQFIGPLHQNRREIEGRLSTACENRTVVLDANKITGKIQLYCCKVDEQCALKMLEDVLDVLTKPLLQKCVEVPVGKTDQGVRVVLGAGGEVINILMPYQYRTLIVKQKLQSDKEIEVSDVEEFFSLYGEITDIKPYVKKDGKDPSYWGTVTFMRDIDAKNAMALLTSSANRFYEAIPQLPRTNSNISRDFKVKLTWWRRHGKGIAYVKMAWPEDFAMALAAGSVTIDGRIVSIQQCSDNDVHDTTNQLYLKGLRYNILEDDITAAFKRLIGLSNRIKHIVIPREASETSERMYIALCEKIERKVSRYAPKGSFDITFVPDPMKNQKCIRYTVIVSFSNPNEGQNALNGLRRNPPSFGIYPVHVTAELETSVTIWKNVYEAVRSEIEPTIEFIMSQNPNVSVKTNTSRAGNVFLNINSNDASLLGHVKALLHDVVQADILECGRNKEIARLFTRDGRCEMKRIEKETGAVIFVDNRTMSVSIQGTQTRRTEALSYIIKYLDTLADLLERQLQLRGDGKPRGVMKELISKYGTDLEQMKEHTGVKSLKLDIRNHQITVLGDEDSIGKMENLLQEICCNLENVVHHEPSELPDCPVCMCPVEPSSMYRLEYCGHPYCSECIKNLLKSAIQDKIFPILCVAESCKQPLVIEDLTALIQQGCTTQRDLMKSSLSLFVSKNNTQFRYCITPDCHMVYRITAEGMPFACSECQQRICTACHVQYHNGLTCSMYQEEKRDENKIDSWLRKDIVNRKLCPKCSAPIEKDDGCNHMQCESCHVHFCWVCLKTFSSAKDCYGHLHSVHNSFM